jgi:hypothetical protein
MTKPGGTFKRWAIGLSRKLRYFLIFLAVAMAIMLSDVTPLDDGTPLTGDIDPIGRITLTEIVSQRLGIQTAPIRKAEVEGRMQKAVPYAAVLYGLHGETWLYASPAPLVFVRQPITIGDLEGDVGLLLDGPPVSTEIVTAGAAELFGVESGLDEGH